MSGGFIPHIDSAVEEFSPLNIRGLEIVQPLSTENEGAESRGTPSPRFVMCQFH